jgi:hypothetical protein
MTYGAHFINKVKIRKSKLSYSPEGRLRRNNNFKYWDTNRSPSNRKNIFLTLLSHQRIR